jgi:uncharacterized protein
MSGIKDLQELLKEIKPEQIPGRYVFSTVSEKEYSGLTIKPKLVFQESEGITLIVEKDVADTHGLAYSGEWAWITLTIHSDLEAVGFLAALTPPLAEQGISVNVVSAYYHDHLFVPHDKAQQALDIIGRQTSTP